MPREKHSRNPLLEGKLKKNDRKNPVKNFDRVKESVKNFDRVLGQQRYFDSGFFILRAET
ncbi:hypothetical protein CSA56_18660 [candidate division KSB3 bacterium]|uniref:Uncharacterized protein n=1 Tax=candidate division KSB3 bacterium TaxID=2044937 RepID=A0A2G6K6H9_9BACT|nr:MAG: hypothetical protein CSA56_18660 [candidate division KSB3 bacterium]